ncbi:elongator complex protein 3 [Anaerosinus massiliensis]|uniref:elongator complex protein 3 n=1 Tax=Massilibacillus massiliensis TaxID=1806837 RepID=UPI000AD2DE3D|nr:radical SAM protein [Massilibacillus massiliensis]
MKNYIIPIFIPHYGCQHQCIFCNQYKITGMQTNVTANFVQETIQNHLNKINQERNIEVAFYGGSFTALSIKKQKELLSPAYEFFKKKKIDGVRVSTRPDCINEEILVNLLKYGVRIVELGVQSLDDQVLSNAQRGHTREAVYKAIDCIKRMNLQFGIQLMPGLPEDNLSKIMSTTYEVIHLKPNFVRIYPTLVLAKTQLAVLFYKKEYKPLTLETAVKYCAIMKALFEKNNIPVIRVGLQATEALNDDEVRIAGPYHPAFGEMVDMYLFYITVSNLFELLYIKNKKIILHHHPKDTSKIRGMKNENQKKWYAMFHPKSIIFKQDLNRIDRIVVEYEEKKYTLDVNSI